MSIPESHVRRRLEQALEIYADAVVPSSVNEDLWRAHHIKVIESQAPSAAGFLVGIFTNEHPSAEIARFAISVSARKVPLPRKLPEYTIGGKSLVDVELPTDERKPLTSDNALRANLSPEIEGTWGPVTLDGVLNYAKTPVNGDLFTGPDGTVWRVTASLNPSNKDEVTLESESDGRVFTSKPPQGWATPVTFRRGAHGTASALLASELGATIVRRTSR